MNPDSERPSTCFARGAWLCGLAALAVGLTVSGCGESQSADGQAVFKLRKVSVFERGGDSFLRGQSIQCETDPNPDMKAYPVFASEKPLFGSVRFGMRRAEPDSGTVFHLALDESEGTGEGYDRFYFDLNRDGDLRNDGIRSPQRRAPVGAELGYSSITQQCVFDFLDVPFDFGELGLRPVQVLPRFYVTEYEGTESHHLSFVRTRLYAGEIRVGGKDFKVRLGNDYAITGRLDFPGTALVLSETDSKQLWYGWWGGDRLMAAHRFGDTYFTFRSNPVGNRLTVRPYAGELGVFRLGAGTRTLDRLAMSGSLEARERAVAVGAMSDRWAQAKVEECRLPVGDYLPSYLSLEYGRLRVAISQNYHADGKPRDRTDRPPVYGIRIRKDEPFVLDFSNRSDVLFASPAKDQRVKLGDSVEVKAVLVDPQLDVMIRRLDDTTRKQTEDAEGKRLPYERDLSLDPTVVVTRANGEKVTEGVMPFG